MKTRLTELLGIKDPIIQSGMSIVADPGLVIAVCSAGGLGILGTSRASPEMLRQQIQDIRGHAGGRPFGVNLVPFRPGFKRYLDVVLEEKVPVLSSGMRDPFKTAGMKKPGGVLWVATVGAVRPAVSMEKAGADIVIVQGWEGGGHASPIASMVLVPEAVAAVKVPVVAAGGFSDGKGLAAALCLGAEGVAMGTRFAVVQESPIPDRLKQAFINSADRDAILSASWDGMPYRVISGQRMRRYRGWLSRPWDVIPAFLSTKRDYNCSLKDMMDTFRLVKKMNWSPPQFLVGLEIVRKTLQTGDLATGFCPSGQVVGRIKDIPTCRELIERTVAEAEQIIKGLRARLRG